ncbi:MAG: hypothetical protein QM817_27885 [Archangium sp.]
MRALVAFALLASSLAFADFTLVNESMSNGKNRTVTLSVKANKAWFQLVDDSGQTRTMLRDADQKKMWLINDEKKIVVLVTEEDSKALEARQEKFRAQMKAQLEKMKPEQRARMEQTMLGGGEPDPNKSANFTYEKKGTPSRKVANFPCDEYTIKRDGQPHGEGCFAAWKSVGMTAEEFKNSMLKAMPASAASGPMLQAFEAHANAPGLPVERAIFDAEGKVISRTSLKSLVKTALGPEKFELPKGYTEKKMGEANAPPAGPAAAAPTPTPAPTPAPAPAKK